MKSDKFFLSSNIKYLRSKYKKTQEDIGKICNKKNTAVSNWEKGIREPDIDDLAVLSNYFNVSIGDLMVKDLRLNNTDSEEELKEYNFGDIKVTISKNGKITDKDILETNQFLMQEKIKNEAEK